MFYKKRGHFLDYLFPVFCLFLRSLHVVAAEMRYVHFEKGGPEKLSVKVTIVPSLRSQEVLVKVYATAINRADTIQRKGFYPSPAGESEILGLEAAGTIEKLGPDCKGKWTTGDRVMALLAGGGYAEYVAVPEDLLMSIPAEMSFTTAASIPEVWLTAYQLLHFVGELEKGDTVLIHAGGSGVGTAAVQLCVLAGCKPIVTAGSQSKIQTAIDLGAVAGFNYKTENFSEKVLEFTNGKGVDLILDCVGASYYENNVKCIRVEGRWVVYGLLGVLTVCRNSAQTHIHRAIPIPSTTSGRGGGSINGDIFAQLLRKRVRITGTTIRPRQLEYKKKVTDAFSRDALPLFKQGAAPHLKPIIDSVYPMHKVVDAHKLMESNKNTGKIVLQIHNEETGEITHDEL